MDSKVPFRRTFIGFSYLLTHTRTPYPSLLYSPIDNRSKNWPSLLPAPARQRHHHEAAGHHLISHLSSSVGRNLMAPSEATSNSSAAPHKPGSAGASSTTNKAEQETSAAGPIKIMTFNLRYGEAPDGVHGWENRRALVANVLKRYKPVLLGAQEALKYQIEYIMENALGPDYRHCDWLSKPLP